MYPQMPGSKTSVPETSVAAAEKMSGKASTLRDRVLMHLKAAPLTADECAERMECSILSIRPRLAELHAMGKIEDAGIRRPNASGHSAAVWRIKSTSPQIEMTL